MLEIGSLVDGKYKILSQVGQGGMSVVYMAINEKANKTWAVKEVRKDGVLDFEAVKQGLVAETDILKKLSHPNLPSIVDVIDTEDSFIIIMDYVQGNSLNKALDEYGAQPQEYVIEWAKQLCDVLGYLHTRQPAIIYRDMKPANIMLKPDGNITLIDFGTAREFKEKNLADTTCLGTVGYAAPEQFGGMGQTDARTDIYCLGATLYHLVTGYNPSEPPYEMRPIREINPALSSGLERIILKCTQRNPEDRYQSAEELLYALDHYEELDEQFKKKQKGKMKIFLSTVILSVVLVFSGLFLNFFANKQSSNTYSALVAAASNISSMTKEEYNKKIQYFEKAINLSNMGGEKEAYIGLIEAYKDDSNFDSTERNQIITLYTEHENELKKNNDAYVEINFEIGKLYWYYSDAEGSEIEKSVNAVCNYKDSKQYFDKACNFASDDYENINMAKAYATIGKCYSFFIEKLTEGNNKLKGNMRPLFDTFIELSEPIIDNENEADIVRLNLMCTITHIINEYISDFKIDGVSKEEINDLLTKIMTVSKDIQYDTDKKVKLKNSIQFDAEQLLGKKGKVENNYATRQEGES